MDNGRFRFGDFEFDPGTGELRRTDAAAGEAVERLAPQPARLLRLLVESRGDVVTRESIRADLWPDRQVEFDTSLHFCVRQVRSALGDSATKPRYVETLPRRGYRLLPAVENVESTTAAPARRRRSLVFALLVVAVAAASVFVFARRDGGAAEPPLRIGVMPFRAPAGMTWADGAEGIGEWILEDLAKRAGDRAEIVGPTTTSAYDESDATMQRLASEYGLDYVVNGRFLRTEGSGRMLAELIRASDGAHVWVRGYEDLGAAIGLEISRHVAHELDLDENRRELD